MAMLQNFVLNVLAGAAVPIALDDGNGEEVGGDKDLEYMGYEKGYESDTFDVYAAEEHNDELDHVLDDDEYGELMRKRGMKPR